MVTRSTSLLAVLAGAVAVALAIIAGPGCSIDSRSDAYACDPGCPSDRVCVDGWCIARDAGAPIDGRTADAAVDAAMCPAQCSSCMGGTCHITCDNGGSCSAPVMCPAGMPCQVDCNGNGSCGGGVRCAPGAACTINCDGPNSCAGQIQCGTGRCDVTCGGTSSCAAGTDCATSCQCDTQCAPSACTGGNNCPAPAQCEQSGECISQAGVCRSC